jgi:hypothetical protein
MSYILGQDWPRKSRKTSFPNLRDFYPLLSPFFFLFFLFFIFFIFLGYSDNSIIQPLSTTWYTSMSWVKNTVFPVKYVGSGELSILVPARLLKFPPSPSSFIHISVSPNETCLCEPLKCVLVRASILPDFKVAQRLHNKEKKLCA